MFSVEILVMLDLSAAFDTIDHSILLQRLNTRFGFSGKALSWFESYLVGRHQSVKVSSASSETKVLKYGVPQGSVLGPVLFSLYCAPLEDIIRRHGLDFMVYTDDTQIYFSFKSGDIATNCIEQCVDKIRTWMAANRLVLNDGKTELVHFYSKFRNPSILNNVRIGSEFVHPVNTVRNLGFNLDNICSLSSHITSICKSASFALYRIGRIRSILDRTYTEKLIHAFITSRLDYCNSLLLHAPDYLLKGIQSIQNSAARLVCRTKKSCHITPLIFPLHWLPVAQRIEFKVLVTVFKILHNQAPSYLCELISFRQPARTTRSFQDLKLIEPRYKQEFYGKRAFSIAAPRLWNLTPFNIRHAPSLECFKSRLKTHLFKTAFLI